MADVESSLPFNIDSLLADEVLDDDGVDDLSPEQVEFNAPVEAAIRKINAAGRTGPVLRIAAYILRNFPKVILKDQLAALNELVDVLAGKMAIKGFSFDHFAYKDSEVKEPFHFNYKIMRSVADSRRDYINIGYMHAANALGDEEIFYLDSPHRAAMEAIMTELLAIMC